MGNRVSTSTSPFSLEDLEALARGPSLFDAPPHDAADSTGSCADVLFRKELRAEVERQYVEYDTSLHALRCVLDRSGTRHHLCSHRANTAAGPSGGAPRSISSQGRGKKPPGKSRPSLGSSTTAVGRGPTREPPQSLHEWCGSRDSDPNATEDSTAAAATVFSATAADASLLNANVDCLPQRRVGSWPGVVSTSAPPEALLSPRSWLFREVSVQPVDLTRRTEFKATEVYVLVVVQRTTMLGTPATSTAPATPSMSFTNARATTSPHSFPAAGAAARWEASSAAMVANATAEWPRDMVQLFTPRGLTVPFSTDMTRPTLSSSSHGGAGHWHSLSVTPRTNGSTSGRPTPRSATAASAATLSSTLSATPTTPGNGCGVGGFLQASARSTPSLATPRASEFHFSVHLLTGKQADAIVAAAGLFTARAVEKLFLDCAEFDRRLFYNLNVAKLKVMAGGYGMHPSPDVTSGRHGSGSGSNSTNAAARNPRKSPKASLSSRGGATTSTAITGNTTSRDVNNSNSAPSTSRQYRTAMLEASKELRRELLAVTRLSSVTVPVPCFNKRSSDHVTSTVVSSNPAELYSLNAVYRVLSGVRVGTPRWTHTGDVVSALNSAPYSVPGGASAAVAGGSSSGAAMLGATGPWYVDPLLSFRPPRRSVHGDGAAPSAATPSGTMASIPSLNISSWLQGPQPLDVHRAARAAPAAMGSSGSAQPAATGATTPRMGRTPRRAWVPPSTSRTPSPPQLPSLALGVLSDDHRVGRVTPPGAAFTSPTTLTLTASTAETHAFSLPLSLLCSATPGGAANVCSTKHSASAEQSITDASSLVSPAAALPPLQLLNTEASVKGEETVRRTSNPVPTADALSLPRGQEDGAQPDGCAAECCHHTRHYHHSHAGGGAQAMDGITGHYDIGAEGVSANRNGEASALPPVEDAEYNEVYVQQERAQRLKASQPVVTEVLPYLFVGGEDAARDRAQLLRKGITHVVNTVSCCCSNFYPELFRYFTLSLSDAADEPIFSLFAVVNAFIENALERHQGRVFVHCQQGVSRSCTFIIAYIMWKKGLCYDRAYELVRARRNVCNPNLGFFMNLRLWEAQLSTPLLNSVFAYAPYTSTSPMPFCYQLTAYFDCATSSTVAGAAASCSTLPLPVSSSCSPEGRLPGFLSPRDKEAHKQLRHDVLTRATDMSDAPQALPSTLSLDPRLAYLFLFAPGARAADRTSRSNSLCTDWRRAKEKGHQRPRLARSTNVGPGAGTCSDEDTSAVTGCVVMGPHCLNKVYTERALTACRQLLRFNFYNGEARTSLTNTGRVVHFHPMRPVRLLPTFSATCPPSTSSPFPPTTAAVPVEVAQQLLWTRVSSQLYIRMAQQSQWDALLSNTQLGAMLSYYIAEEDRLDSREAVRRNARERATEGSGLHSSSSSRVAAGRPTSATGRTTLAPNLSLPVSPTALTSSLLRTGRRTPRTPRQLHTSTSGNSGYHRRGKESAKLASSDTAYWSSTGTSSSQRRSFSGSAPAVASTSVPQSAVSQLQHVTLLPIASSASAAAFPPHMESAGVSLPLQGISGLSLAAAAAHNENGPTHVAVRMAEGESFAYAYPFTASAKVTISDLDDLEDDQCYVLGFQQRTGTFVYLWRGTDAAESSTDVVSAFVRQLLSASDPAGQATVARALKAGEWATCSLNFPRGDDDGAAAASVADKADVATEVLAGVRVLYVEQGNEPKEFFTLL
nr:unnamed protein product [Leishmania braziliensis]